MVKTITKKDEWESSVYLVNGRPFLQIKRGVGAWITLDLGKIKEDVDKRIVDSGKMTQEEIDREGSSLGIFKYMTKETK